MKVSAGPESEHRVMSRHVAVRDLRPKWNFQGLLTLWTQLESASAEPPRCAKASTRHPFLHNVNHESSLRVIRKDVLTYQDPECLSVQRIYSFIMSPKAKGLWVPALSFHIVMTPSLDPRQSGSEGKWETYSKHCRPLPLPPKGLVSC